MDMLKTIREIGFFETGCNLGEVIGSKNVQAKVGGVMPLPEPELAQSIPRIVNWLTSFGKDKYMLLSPEIALVDMLAENDSDKEVIWNRKCENG